MSVFSKHTALALLLALFACEGLPADRDKFLESRKAK